MKAILEFNLPEENYEFQTASKAMSYRIAFDEVWEQLFRPRHKHGYRDEELNKLIETEIGEKIMEALEQEYLNIKNDRLADDED